MWGLNNLYIVKKMIQTENNGATDIALTNSQLESIEYQKKRYEHEADQYQRHHGDYYSQLYRTEFVRNRLFEFDVENKIVLDACARLE